jgi:hydrogenase-4 component B
VLFAISQHDIKRLLAYHSVENIGIILLGIGISIVGSACGMPQLALFGMAGALMHVINHALFKSLLFLGAGSIIRQSGAGELDRLGGLIKTMPLTAVLFLAGSIAICGLPFFNGFISELLIYSGAIHGALYPTITMATVACLIAALALALIGGLAAACFTKVFGVVFLGEPREPRPISGEVPMPMLGAMAILALSCLGIGLGSILIMPGVVQTALPLAGAVSAGFGVMLTALAVKVSLVLAAIIGGAIGIAAAVRLVRGKGIARRTVTWDCGYVKPAPSMQYTASSFAAPIVGYFGASLAAKRKLTADGELFPRRHWSFHSTVKDWYLTDVYIPAVRFFNRQFSILHWFQNGKSGLYVAYIALTIAALIVWKFCL